MFNTLRKLLFISIGAAHVDCRSLLNSRAYYALKDNHPVPPSWTAKDRAHPDHVILLQIGLEQSQFDEVVRHLYEVSDPSHSRYGQHLTHEEVNELIKPTEETESLVHEWLIDHGIEPTQLEYSPARDWINVKLPISTVEYLLDTEYSVFAHEDGSEVIRALEWSLPRHLHDHISTIQPTNSFFRPRSRPAIARDEGLTKRSEGSTSSPADLSPRAMPWKAPKTCDPSLVTIPCLREYYGIENYTVQSAGKNSMALNIFDNNGNNRSDTELFLQKYRPEARGGAYQFSQVSVNGGILQQTPYNATELAGLQGAEGDLDAQTMLGLGWPTPLVAYSTGGENYQDVLPSAWTELTPYLEPYLAFLNYITAQPYVPNVISTSWGSAEMEVPPAYAKKVCNMFAQLGTRGVSVFWPSGDNGVGFPGYCVNNDGTNSSFFMSVFPASCPYVTTVGGTTGFSPEVAAAGFFPAYVDPFPLFRSGGGFSNYFPRPAYQDSAITFYLKSFVGNEHAGWYNASGRGYPDISAQSELISIFWNGTEKGINGTSAATPAVATIFALVNDALIAEGKPPMGFLNPWIYQGGYKAFNDILHGDSAGCNTTGFPAAPGWDAVTGFGTPYFPDILKLLGLNKTLAMMLKS